LFVFCANNVLVHRRRDPNDVIVINVTQEDDISQGDLPKTDIVDGLQMVAMPAHILVVYGDRDVDNDPTI